MDINIKNMVCNRCIMVVSQIFNEAGINIENILLGKVKTTEEVGQDMLDEIPGLQLPEHALFIG